MFFKIPWGKGGGGGHLGVGNGGLGSVQTHFFKSSKDLLHYSMLLFSNVRSIFDLHCRSF